MVPRLVAVALVLVVLAPAASAFAATEGPVSIDYAATTAPLLLGIGQLAGLGKAQDSMLAVEISAARIGPVPTLTLLDAQQQGPGAIRNVTDATVLLDGGHLYWRLGNDSATLQLTADYAFALALAKSPFAAQAAPGGAAGPAVVMAGPAVTTTISGTTHPALLFPIDANVTVLDASGKAIAGWDHRHVNPSADLQSMDASGGQVPPGTVAMSATGSFSGTVTSQAMAAGLDPSSAQMRISVASAKHDRFLAAVDAVTNATQLFGGAPGGQGAAGADASQALTQLTAISPIFDGAVLVVQPPGNATDAASAPIDATLSKQPIDASPFAFLRSRDLALSWSGGQVGVQGDSTTTVTKSGFATAPPLVVGFVPLLSVLLWLVAIGAVVLFFVKRPPASKGRWSLRGIGWLVYLVVLLGVFWVWDRSFAATFGTSVLTQLFGGGAGFEQLALIFGVEFIPWTICVLLFALPVRIALGVALRYRGEGSSFKGVAKAGGLVSLAVLGPLYALWVVNVMLAGVLAFAPKMFG